MVRDRTCSETACTSICRRHRRESKKHLTSRIHATTLHDLEDEDENKSRLRVKRIWSVRGRVRGWVLLGDRSQWRWGCGILNLVKVVVHFFISIHHGLQLDSWSVLVSLTLLYTQLCNCRVKFVLWLRLLIPMIGNPTQSSFLTRQWAW